MSNLGESNNPRERRVYAHAMLDRLAQGEVSRAAAAVAISRADQTVKGAKSGFNDRLVKLAGNGWPDHLATLHPEMIRDPDIGFAQKMPVRIDRPEDPERIRSLQAKAGEYYKRIAYVAPDAPGYFGNHSKLTVLERVLDEGVVHPGAMMDEFYGQSNFDMFAAEEAIRIIHDYCTTGGQNNQAGTGLPPVASS